jgi:anti-sigma factor RsiW
MTNENEHVNPHSTTEVDDLVAYLDGETDVESNRRIEALLTRDESARRHLRSLERTWDALDQLPRTHAGDKFTAATVEMIAVREAEALRASERGQRGAKSERWLLAGCIAVTIAGVGFAAARYASAQPDELLLEHLPMIEHLDEYRQAADIDLIRGLASERAFPAAAAESKKSELKQPESKKNDSTRK